MRTTALTAGGAALVLALSACGTDTDDQANSTDEDQDSPQVFSSIENLAETSQESAEQHETMTFSMEMTPNGRTVTKTGESRITDDDLAISMETEARGTNLEARLLDDTMYLKLPEEQLPEGKSWTEILPDDADEELSHAAVDSFEMAKGMVEEMDVRDTLEELKTTGTITDSEKAEFDGEPATHYWIDQDTEKVLKQQADSTGLSDAELDEILEQTPETRPAELWLNEDQLPMKITMNIDDSETPESEPENLSGPITMRYADWGTEVDIEAPPAEEIADPSEITPN